MITSQQKPSIIYAGSSQFSAELLEFLSSEKIVQILKVITLPEKPVGRGKKLQKNPVHQKALELQLDVTTTASLKDRSQHEDLTLLEPDYLLVVAFGLLIPTWLLELPKKLPLNIHASSLPRWRGASPIHRALEHNDRETGCDFMIMTKGLDEGPILLREKVTIEPSDIFVTLEKKLLESSKKVSRLFFDNPDLYSPIEQEGQSTYANKITKSEGFVDMSAKPEEIIGKFRAFHQWPGLFVLSDKDERIKLNNIALEYDSHSDKPSGSFSCRENRLYLNFPSFSIEILEIQFAGKKAVCSQEIIKHKDHKLFKVIVK